MKASTNILGAFTAALGLLLMAWTLTTDAQVVTNPLITGASSGPARAGGGTSTYNPGGYFVAPARTTTDTAVQNTWQVVTVAVPANTLAVNGQTAKFIVDLLGANNANTHEYEAYFSASTATCGSTGANVCNSGCFILPSVTNTTAFATVHMEVDIIRTGSATQDYGRQSQGTNTNTAIGTCTIDLTADSKFVFATRNTSAAAASLAQLDYRGIFFPVP